jgi:hypothetical protein
MECNFFDNAENASISYQAGPLKESEVIQIPVVRP